MQSVTRAAQEKGCVCGWDLAHAIGNVPMSLHDWNIDFAVWCSYKYLNAGPGAIGGLFMHEKWDPEKSPQLAGWWGHVLDTRFKMPPIFDAISGAQGWQQSNPSVIAAAALQGSLEVFRDAGGIQPLRSKSILLTRFLETLLAKSRFYLKSGSVQSKGFQLITPSDRDARGCQLSILILDGSMQTVFDSLKARGVICDERKPDVIRLAPIPLYNSFEDCWRAATQLEAAFESL